MSKLALVTGASKNIGKSIARKFISKGYSVIGTYNTTDEKKIQKVIDDLGDIKMHQVDFCDAEAVGVFISKMKAYRFDVIVNNAGMLDCDDEGEIVNEFYNFNLSAFDNVMKCNFYAPLRICLELKENVVENGAIVNITSTDGMQATYASLSYSASKAALINLTASLSNSFFSYKNVRVNSISPGWIAADEEGGMNTNPDDPNLPSNKAKLLTPLDRNGKTTEVADVVFYLTQNESSFIHGTNIVVDGGFSNHDVIYYEEATGKSLLKTD